MSLGKALVYFAREAIVGLIRSWRVSLVAIATSGVSLFLAGLVLLATGNLQRVVSDWRREAKLIVYLRDGTTAEVAAALRARLAAAPGVLALTDVDAAAATVRFRQHFPSLSELATSGGPRALPSSLEAEIAPEVRAAPAFAGWLEQLRRDPAVALVDDDRDWLREAERLLGLVRSVGLGLSTLLLAASVFTIASVVRLIAYLYRDEIAVLRLVGATEFYLRGPFYLEGLLQGLAGGLFALGGLWLANLTLFLPSLASSLVAHLLAERFLSPAQQLLLPALGAAAGWIGAVLSLGRERTATAA